MAGKIQLTPAELLAQSAEMLALEQEFASLFQKTESLLGQVNSDWSANLANNFAGKITSAQKACTSIINMLDGGAKIAETSANTMDSVDQLLGKLFNGDGDSGESGGGSRWYGPGGTFIQEKYGRNWTNTTQIWKEKYESENGGWIYHKAEATEKKEWDLGFKLKDKWVEREEIYKDSHYITGKEGDVTYYKKEATFFEQKKERSISASLFEATRTGDHGSAYFTVGNAEAHASIAGGFYAYNADGKRIFSPGVKAEVGVSATALKGGVTGQLGDDMLGVTGSVDAAAGKVEAKASIELGALDKNGRPQLNVEASAEAIAVEATGSVKANILGGGIEGKVGVNVGIGAHAKIGIKDGIIKCDIGASIGLGVSADIEIDVGGMVDTAIENAEKIADAAGDAVEAVSDAAEAAWDAAGDAVDAAKDVAKEVAKGAGKVAKKAGKVAGDVIEGIGDFFGF